MKKIMLFAVGAIAFAGIIGAAPSASGAEPADSTLVQKVENGTAKVAEKVEAATVSAYDSTKVGTVRVADKVGDGAVKVYGKTKAGTIKVAKRLPTVRKMPMTRPRRGLSRSQRK